MNKGFNKGAQGGFTLIELIVVIVILGILAATALPKFASLSGDARKASLTAARGAMSSAAALVHGKWLIDSTINKVEGVTVTIKNGYPDVNTIDDVTSIVDKVDYDVAIASGTLTLTPVGLPSDLKGTCFVSYTEVSTAGNAPVMNQNLTKCE